jgi:hypothetical protein
MKDNKLRRYIENNEEELLLNYIHEEAEKVYNIKEVLDINEDEDSEVSLC